MVWSFSTIDPTDPLGNSAVQHDYQGSLSVNLLSGLTDTPTEPDNLQFFDVVVSNVKILYSYNDCVLTIVLLHHNMHIQVTIPSNDTTYWCKSIEISQDFQTSTKYIIRVRAHGLLYNHTINSFIL